MALNLATKYPGKIDTTSDPTGYPYGQPQNITVPGDGTGTPWEKGVPKDIFGFFQAMLVAAGITPSGTADKVGASQYLQALRAIAGVPGVIDATAFSVDPATIGVRMLLLEGQGLLVTDYQELVDNCWVGAGDNDACAALGGAFFKDKNGDGEDPDPTGDYFMLPDMRGAFLRGFDATGVLDPEGGANRRRGQLQLDAIQRHNHLIAGNFAGAEIGGSNYGKTVGVDEGTGTTFSLVDMESSEGNASATASHVKIGEDITSGFAPAVGRVDVETRPASVTASWAIWY